MESKTAAGEADETREPFEIEITDEALYAYSDIQSESILRRIEALIDMLALYPFYGEEYEPVYEAAQPPVPCRVLFCTHYGIYYHVNETEKLITVIAIESQRRDPLSRFSLLGDR